MGDREETDRQNQERQNNAATPLPAAVAQPAPDPKQPHGEDVHNGPEQNPEETMKWFSNPDWWMVALTALLFVVGAVTLKVFYGQFTEMQTQTGILNAQAKQAAKDSVEAATKVEKQLSISDKQAGATEESVKTIQQQMRLEQRGWVGEISVSLDNVEIGKPLYAHVILNNSGKTVAKHVIANFHLTFPRALLQILPRVSEMSPEETSVGVLVPNGQYNSKFGNQVNAQAVDKDTVASSYTYIWGEIVYRDIFNQHHETLFCAFRKGAEGDFLQCPFHNDAN
jgi:ATPase subunit of ABC transporter with duplicated ATPase domains